MRVTSHWGELCAALSCDTEPVTLFKILLFRRTLYTFIIILFLWCIIFTTPMLFPHWTEAPFSLLSSTCEQLVKIIFHGTTMSPAQKRKSKKYYLWKPVTGLFLQRFKRFKVVEQVLICFSPYRHFVNVLERRGLRRAVHKAYWLNGKSDIQSKRQTGSTR